MTSTPPLLPWVHSSHVQHLPSSFPPSMVPTCTQNQMPSSPPRKERPLNDLPRRLPPLVLDVAGVVVPLCPPPYNTCGGSPPDGSPPRPSRQSPWTTRCRGSTVPHPAPSVVVPPVDGAHLHPGPDAVAPRLPPTKGAHWTTFPDASYQYLRGPPPPDGSPPRPSGKLSVESIVPPEELHRRAQALHVVRPPWPTSSPAVRAASDELVVVEGSSLSQSKRFTAPMLISVYSSSAHAVTAPSQGPVSATAPTGLHSCP